MIWTSMGGIIEKETLIGLREISFNNDCSCDGYHGLSFAEEFGPAAFTMRARAEA